MRWVYFITLCWALKNEVQRTRGKGGVGWGDYPLLLFSICTVIIKINNTVQKWWIATITTRLPATYWWMFLVLSVREQEVEDGHEHLVGNGAGGGGGRLGFATSRHELGEAGQARLRQQTQWLSQPTTWGKIDFSTTLQCLFQIWLHMAIWVEKLACNYSTWNLSGLALRHSTYQWQLRMLKQNL